MVCDGSTIRDGSSRTGLELDDTSRTNFGGLGFKLEGDVLEHIPVDNMPMRRTNGQTDKHVVALCICVAYGSGMEVG